MSRLILLALSTTFVVFVNAMRINAVYSCGEGSIFHYYTCCDYNRNMCCFNLEGWVIVVLVITGLLTIVCCLGCCGVAFWGVQRANKQ
ncbi:protein SUP-1 [Ditylenchus destructor]|uniref:Protein SUP-1 n=1 Tax=Ditylenchus destructor TaxID=166010 RepID=A0AAD4NLQ8_9BILA|nr:protein SUP-1 [Ditylenchus destructor]